VIKRIQIHNLQNFLLSFTKLTENYRSKSYIKTLNPFWIDSRRSRSEDVYWATLGHNIILGAVKRKFIKIKIGMCIIIIIITIRLLGNMVRRKRSAAHL